MADPLDLTEASEGALHVLDALIGSALREQLDEGVRAASEMLASSDEAFGWHFLDLSGTELPPSIRSGAVFVLPAGSRPEPHRHPNSVQHMRALSGRARLRLGQGPERAEVLDVGEERRWVVIGKDVVHAFEVPSTQDFVVVSFHTVPQQEIIEESAEGARGYG